jgi:two-component system response regulator PilR (NtrC family)
MCRGWMQYSTASFFQAAPMIPSFRPFALAGSMPRSDDDAPPVLQQQQFRLLGESIAMRQVRQRIVRLAQSIAPVAIYGESGCGKELAARDIHAFSPRSAMPFIAVNCGAIPEALMEAEFFGYRRGAFTGAMQDRDGFFQAAQGGTLLLDEVADLPLAMQVKLLRAIQERRVRKLGESREEAVDVRIISATHQNLARNVQQGLFRQDLYYRLNVIALELPPLRMRRDDIAPLAQAILRRLAPSTPAVVLSDEALVALGAHDFPGNVRELENIIERALAFADDGVISVADLDFEQGAPGFAGDTSENKRPASVSEGRMPSDAALVALPLALPAYLQSVERDLIRRALRQCRFNRTRAAALLGISFRQLRYRLQRLAIHDPE